VHRALLVSFAYPVASTARSRYPRPDYAAACTTHYTLYTHTHTRTHAHTHARARAPPELLQQRRPGCFVVSGGRHVHGRAGVGRRRVHSSLARLGCGRGHLARRDRSDIRIRSGRRRAGWRRGRRRWHREDEALGRLDSQAGRLVGEDRRQAACGGTFRSTRGRPEAGTRVADLQQCAPPGQAALRLRCARYRRPT